MDWDRHVITIDGVEYLMGTAGSLVLGCENCGAEHFREPHAYFQHPDWHTCFVCRPVRLMLPVKAEELETKWLPLWERTDGPSYPTVGEQQE